MSSKSNDQGRAYEFICLFVLEKEIKKIRPVTVDKNSSYFAAERAWSTLTNAEQLTYENSASAAVSTIFDLEPKIVEDGEDIISLLIQTDKHGEAGDVRDILIIRSNIEWEIGLSIKHNHFAVKHSRLCSTLNFGKSWYDIPCSNKYWSDIKDVFDYLTKEQYKKTKFSELPNKDRDVYIPLLNAFIDEIKRQNSICPELPQRLVEYLLGKYDFYKVIGIDNERIMRIQGYNLHGSLNQNGLSKKATITVPIVSLPKRIIALQRVPNKTNTVELCLDGGWQFSFRIHNAATLVEPSLKFDIQIIGMPTAILTLNCKWKYFI